MAAVPSVAFPFKGSDTNSYAGQTVPLDAGGNVPVSLANQPLPAGASTTALQTTGNTVLASIDTHLQARLPLDTNGNLKQVLYDATGAAVSYGGTTSVQGVAGGVAVPADTVVRATAANRGGLTTVKAVSATVAAGGSGYAVGDTITNAAGIFTVGAVGSGAVTAVTATTPAGLTATPSNPLAQTATSGGGSGATLSPAYAAAAVQFAAANTGRRGFAIQNQSSGSLWLSGAGTATADQNSLMLAAGDYFESSPHHSGTGALSIIGTTAGQPFYAREF